MTRRGLTLIELLCGITLIAVFLLLLKYLSRVFEINFFVTIALALFIIHIFCYLGILITDRKKIKNNNEQPKN